MVAVIFVKLASESLRPHGELLLPDVVLLRISGAQLFVVTLNSPVFSCQTLTSCYRLRRYGTGSVSVMRSHPTFMIVGFNAAVQREMSPCQA